MIICKIVELENTINADIDQLVDLKVEITATVQRMDNLAYRTILEQRYLCYKTWEQIAANMGYDVRWLHRLHGKALREAEKLLNPERSH